MTVKAKFEVSELTHFKSQLRVLTEKGTYEYQPGLAERVKFTIVNDGKPENAVFEQWSPYGEMQMVIMNPDIHGFFKPGDQYFFDITKA
jgi:hypothetical protein